MRKTLHRPGPASIVVLVLSTCLWAEDAPRTWPATSLAPIIDFAHEIERSIHAGDPSVLDSSVALDLLMHRAIHDLEAPAKMRDEFLDGIRSRFSLGGDVCLTIAEAGSYTLLRVRNVGGKPHALFRLLSNDGLNYHDFLLARSPDGTIRVIDVYVYTNGEWLSKIVRRGFLPLVAESQKGIPAGPLTAEGEYMRSVPVILNVQRFYREGRYREALDLLDQLPRSVKKNRNVMMIRFNVAARIGSDSYIEALRDLKNTFPDDPGLGLVLIDYHYSVNEFDTALDVIDRLDNSVGGDPYLDFLRANILHAASRSDEAKQLARQAILAEPFLEDPYWTLVTISLDERDFSETARLLTEIETSLGLEIGVLTEVPEYAGFVNSEAYREWSRSRSIP